MYELPSLPYGLNELEPVISEEIMKLHYEKHHAGYVKNLNIALEKEATAQKEEQLAEQIRIGEAIRFNGGGHFNHSLFWENLLPTTKGGGNLQVGPLKEVIVKTFGSFERCIQLISEKSIAVQGSGWGWLGYCTEQGHLRALSTEKHELPKGFMPLLCIDVWEHAYYLQYKNARADFVKAIWSIINWKKVEERFIAAKG